MKLVLAILGVAATTLLGACVGGDGGGNAGSGDCVYEGSGYDHGEHFPSADGCNSCTCGDDGVVSCTLLGCGGDGQCTYGKLVYQVGETFPANDGCNSCACGEGGEVGCTTAFCRPPTDCDYGGQGYAVGDTFPAEDGCNSCTCEAGGVIGCTVEDCGGDPSCQLDFEIGDCDAAIPVFWHNPATGDCEQQIYGGCGGNDNRFETFDECVMSCGHASSGVACRVNGQTYPHGAGLPDPFSCNRCSCDQGQVSGCTEIACDDPCPDGTAAGTSCAACGPADGCEILETGCLPACQSDADCQGTDYPLCVVDGGYCAMLCG